ncbi:MAG: zinc ribbon domain-containing protein [Pirellulales bacterium]
MPTYDYECDACGHKFELFQSITAEPERRCPKCKKLKLRRLFGTGGAIVFKGSGFYQTDYRSKSYQEKAAADKKASSGESKSSESSSSTGSSSEAKPAAKSDSGGEKKPKSKPASS